LDASRWAAVCDVAALEPDDVPVALEPVPPPVEHEVLWLPLAVELVGFTPDCAVLEFAFAPFCVEATPETVVEL